MSLTSNIICRQAYVRIGAFSGDAGAIATAYTGSLSILNTESFPLQSMYDMLAGIEGEMATVASSNEDSVLRSVLQDVATVVSGARIPSVGDGGGNIIGVWGQVRDADSGIELTPGLHEDEIRTIVNGPTGLFKSTLYSYALRPPRIYATVPDLEIDCCTFDLTARQAAIDGNEELLFQQCQDAYFYGLMANLKNEDPSYTLLANDYVPLYEAWLVSQGKPIRAVAQEAAA